jgi:hypothetical protein
MEETTQTPVTPAETQTPSQPVSMTTEDGSWNPDFLSTLPDEMGKHSSFEKYKNPADYFKGSINAQKLVGEKASEFWTSEDPDHVAKRREIMGVPNDASEYLIDEIQFPEGMQTEQITARIELAKEKMQELGLSKEQAKGLLEWDLNGGVEAYNNAMESNRQQLEQAEKELKAEWKGEKFQYNVDKSRNALEHLGLDWADDPKFGNNPKFIKDVFEKIVPLISDDTIIEARQQQNVATMQDMYDAQWNKMAKMDANDPNYQRELAKMQEITNKMDQMN